MESVEDKLAGLAVPADWNLRDWLQYERARLIHQYPRIKEGRQTAEISYELAAMMRVADQNQAEWEEKRQIVRLNIREELGWAKRAVTPDGRPVAERRDYDVESYWVAGYHVDAIFGLRLLM